MRQIIVALLICLVYVSATAQSSYYFIYFKDKPIAEAQKHQLKRYFSEKAILRRAKFGIPITAEDFPPDSAYVQTIVQKGFQLKGMSRWLNGVLVVADPKSIADSLKTLDFVTSFKYAGKYNPTTNISKKRETDLECEFELLEQKFYFRNKDSLFYGFSHNQLVQLNVQPLHRQNIRGKGVTIAVFDAGFKNAYRIQALNHLFKNKKIVGLHDFVENSDDVFVDDEHGLAVLSCLAAWQPGVLMGAASEADYILLRTENASSETLVEEYFWLLAAEYADSAGADIINSSLGYTRHDEKVMGHTYLDMNGKNTVVSKAADMAADKGMLVFVSAGNEGNDPWRYIAAPADADNVVTVGAVDKHGHYVGFSSIGPTADNRLKPDVAAMGSGTAIVSADGKVNFGNGTSYASPVLCGAAALLVQKHPHVHPQVIKQLLMWSANKAYRPDRFSGYGIPDIALCDFILSDQQLFGVAYARQLSNFVQVFINCYVPQKVKITIYNNLGEMITETIYCKNKGLNHLMIELPKNFRNSGIKAVESLFLQNNISSVFLF